MPHWIELEDDEGKTHRLLATNLIKGVCESCGQATFVTTRLGAMACPHCVTGTVRWVWGEARMAFVPEPSSRFTSTPPSMFEDEDTKP